MRKICDGKVYDTATATCVASCGAYYSGDFSSIEEHLYRTPRGKWFVHILCGRTIACGGDTGGYLTPTSDDDVLHWCEEHHCSEVVDQYLPHLVTEA